jgi:hypothetical protein
MAYKMKKSVGAAGLGANMRNVHSPAKQVPKDPPLNRSEVFNIPRKMGYEGGKMVLQDKPIYGGMLDEVNIDPYTRNMSTLEEVLGNKATGGLKPVYPIFDLLTGAGVTRAGAKKLASGITSKANTALSKATAPSLYKNIDNSVFGFKFTDNIASQAAKQPLALPEPITYYRATTPKKFSGIMNPVSTSGKPGSMAENLRFFTPNKNVASSYLNKEGVGVTARMNINKPFIQEQNRILTNEFVQNLMDQGYDAIQTLPFDGSKNLRDAFEVVPLNKNILSDLKKGFTMKPPSFKK